MFKSFNKIKEEDKKEILEMIFRYVSSGMNLYNAISSASKDVKDERLSKILRKVVLDSDRNNDIVGSLRNNNIIDDRELVILQNAKKNIKVAIQEVLKLSRHANQFEKTMITSMIIPLFVFSITMLVPIMVKPFIDAIFDKFKRTLSLEDVNLAWYLATTVDYAYIYAIIGATTLLSLVATIIFYFYTYNNRIDLTYKYFKYKAFVDTPFIINLMVSLNKSTGMNLTYVCANLRKTISPKSLAYFFKKIENEKDDSNLFKTFSNLGIDNGVSRICSLGQNKGINNFWANMEKGLTFSEEQLANESLKWSKRSKRNNLLSFLVVIGVLISSILYINIMSNEIQKTLKEKTGTRR